TPDLPQGDDATVGFEFVENLIGDDEVVVDDDRDTEGQFPDTISDDATYDYSESFSCSRNIDDYTNGEYSYTVTNIATLVGDNTNLSDNASVVVTCKLRYEDETATGAGLGWPGANWFMYTPCADALFPSSVKLDRGPTLRCRRRDHNGYLSRHEKHRTWYQLDHDHTSEWCPSGRYLKQRQEPSYG